MESNAASNPFVGLRPFEEDESYLFFGRREHTVALLQKLHHTGFVAVVGSSGSGKSSLVRAGLIPMLRGGFLVEDRDRWFAATMRPGKDPLQNLAFSLASLTDTPPGKTTDALPESGQTKELPDKAAVLLADLHKFGSKAVADYLRPFLEAGDTNVLLLVDQFEELFRYDIPPDKKNHFVSILLDLIAQTALPLYVVITMRSDFLGNCDAFFGLPEALNRSQYLVPRLTRRQIQEIIEAPIHLSRSSISKTLTERILNEIPEETDMLPLVQHALMRTWHTWQQEKNEPESEITNDHYEATGTIANALARHADEALVGMTAEDLALTRILFQALTHTDKSNRHVRRPVLISDILKVTQAPRPTIDKIIERFQSEGRSFLVQTEGDDPLVDISHESLIRQWGTLRQWVDKETVDRDRYVRIADEAMRYANDLRGLLKDPELQIAREWWDTRNPTEGWAIRYRPGFKQAQDFLKDSKKVHEEEVTSEKRRARITKGLSISFAIAFVVATGFGYLFWQNSQELEVKNQESEEALARYVKSEKLKEALGYSVDSLNNVLEEGNLRLVEDSLRLSQFHFYRILEKSKARDSMRTSFPNIIGRWGEMEVYDRKSKQFDTPLNRYLAVPLVYADTFIVERFRLDSLNRNILPPLQDSLVVLGDSLVVLGDLRTNTIPRLEADLDSLNRNVIPPLEANQRELDILNTNVLPPLRDSLVVLDNLRTNTIIPLRDSLAVLKRRLQQLPDSLRVP